MGPVAVSLTGWYGVGTALETLRRTVPEIGATWSRTRKECRFALCGGQRGNYLATTDESVWNPDAAMVEDLVLRERFLTRIRTEFRPSRRK
ncbi:MAG: hypothetical protein IPN71_12425 [Fibrobacteres bacterium]|nr:hypothetical protein [Fibrobacterota bacterium]